MVTWVRTDNAGEVSSISRPPLPAPLCSVQTTAGSRSSHVQMQDIQQSWKYDTASSQRLWWDPKGAWQPKPLILPWDQRRQPIDCAPVLRLGVSRQVLWPGSPAAHDQSGGSTTIFVFFFVNFFFFFFLINFLTYCWLLSVSLSLKIYKNIYIYNCRRLAWSLNINFLVACNHWVLLSLYCDKLVDVPFSLIESLQPYLVGKCLNITFVSHFCCLIQSTVLPLHNIYIYIYIYIHILIFYICYF